MTDEKERKLLAALSASHERNQRLHEAYRSLRAMYLRMPIGSQGAIEVDRLNRSIEETALH